MALINCVECGKEVSDKATSCPNCGNPINSPNLNQEYLCCPKCNSKELHSEHKGFSGGKALAGALLTGGIGILAGTIGSKDVQLTCLKCGNKFKAGEAVSVKANEYELFDYNDENIIKNIREGNTRMACTYIQLKDKTLKPEEIISIAKEYAKRHNLELKPYNPPQGCLGLVVIFIAVGGLLGFLI